MRCLFLKISRSNEMEGSTRNDDETRPYWQVVNHEAKDGLKDSFFNQGKGNLKCLPQIHHTLQWQQILPTSFLQHPNSTKSRSMHLTACSSSTTTTTTKKPWSCNHPAGGLPVGDQMKPIRPSEFHRQGWQHIGQINHTNTCLHTSFLGGKSKKKDNIWVTC